MQESKKIVFLVVDDSNISRKWFVNALPSGLKNKVDIIEASDGFEAIQKYQDSKPDMVFLDITMPKMNGFEALEKIMGIDDQAIVVMVSADRQKTTRQKVLSLGAKAIINKPIDEEELRTILLELIK